MVKRILFWITLMLSFCMASFSMTASAKTTTEPPQIDLTLSKQTVWQREQVILTLRVTTEDLLARLDSQEFQQSGLTIIPFDLSAQEKNNKLLLTYQWVIFPFVAGNYSLNLPRIRFRPNSGRPTKLKFSKPTLLVKKLPIYVPPTMPVGNIRLENSWENSLIVSPNNLLEWNIVAHSDQVSPQTLPAISSLLRSSESLTILPPKRKLIPYKNDQGVSHQQQYQVPIKANKMGLLTLPTLSIQFFDPKTARLSIVTVTPPVVFVVSSWLLGVLGLLILALILLLLWKVFITLQARIRKNTLKKAALTNLKQSKNYNEIRNALNQYAASQGFDNNATLEQFAAVSNQKTKELIDQIQRHEFSKHDSQDSSIRLLAQELAVVLS